MSTSQSQSLSPINGHDSFPNRPPPPVSDHGFPVLAIAFLGIVATAFLLVSYYIFITRGCFRWQLTDPLGRFSIRRAQLNEDPLTSSYSPPSWQSRGLNELLIRDLPTFQFNKNERASAGSSKCVVCLNEFQDREMLRVLPKCTHAFHLDCIDVWLLNSANCPLCRSAISGRNRYQAQPNWIVAPNSSPQDPHPASVGAEEFVENVISGGDLTSVPTNGDSRRFLVRPRSRSSIKFDAKDRKCSKARKFRRLSIVGDGEINVGENDNDDDDRFRVEPIRRSFSMDSVADRHVYLSVQEIIRQNREIYEVRDTEES